MKTTLRIRKLNNDDSSDLNREPSDGMEQDLRLGSGLTLRSAGVDLLSGGLAVADGATSLTQVRTGIALTAIVPVGDNLGLPDDLFKTARQAESSMRFFLSKSPCKSDSKGNRDFETLNALGTFPLAVQF
jgi:hypothetical protein